MTHPDESALLQRLRDGDRTALNELLAAHQTRLYNICLRLLGNRDDAAEVAQEALLKAVQHIDRFRGESKLGTWLVRIATNEATTHLRRRRIRRAASLESPHPNGQADGDADAGADWRHQLADGREPSPDERVQQQEQRLSLQAAIDQLEPDFRAVLVLRDVDQMDYQQIADVLEVPVGTVKSRLFRARLALREQLSERDTQDQDTPSNAQNTDTPHTERGESKG